MSHFSPDKGGRNYDDVARIIDDAYVAKRNDDDGVALRNDDV